MPGHILVVSMSVIVFLVLTFHLPELTQPVVLPTVNRLAEAGLWVCEWRVSPRQKTSQESTAPHRDEVTSASSQEPSVQKVEPSDASTERPIATSEPPNLVETHSATEVKDEDIVVAMSSL